MPRPPVSSIQNGELLAEGKVLECQFRTQPQGGRNQREQSQNRQHHGREVSGPSARKVNRFSAAGVLARHTFYGGKSPRFLIRDRDGIYGLVFRDRVKALDIEEVATAPRCPWQSPYVERVIGTLRRECIDHVIVIGEAHLRRIVRSFLGYYHRARTHLALEKDAPESRSVQSAEQGRVIEFLEVGGLHHRYERRAA